MPLRPTLPHVQLAALFALLTCVNTFPQVLHPRSLIGYHHDAEFSVWRLAWVAQQLPRDPKHLFDANMFYPERGTLAYSDALLLPAVLAAPLHWIRVPPTVVYNAVLLAAMWSSAFAAALLVLDLTRSRAAAAIAGTAFAFTSHQLEHYERLELQVCAWMPLALLALVRLQRSGNWRWGAGLGLACAAQVYSGIYHGVFLVTYLTAVALALAAVSAHRRRQLLAGLAVACGVIAALSIPYLIPYLQTRGVVGERPPFEVADYGARMTDFLASHPNARGLVDVEGFGGAERYLYPGALIVVLAAIALVPPWAPVTIAVTCGLLVALELSRGLDSAVYRWLFDHLFVFRGLRAPARMVVLVQLSLCVLGGMAAARVLGWIATRRLRRVVALVLLAIVVADHRGRPVLRTITEPSRLYGWLARQRDVHVLELPLAAEFYRSHDPEYLYFSTAHWKPLLNGYSGFFPPSYVELNDRLATFPDAGSLDYLRSRHVDVIVLHRRLLEEVEYARIADRLMASPLVTLEARYPEDGHFVDAYRLKRE